MLDVISFEKLLEITDVDLDVIKHNIGCVYMDKTLKPETRYKAIAEAFSKIDEWSSFYHSHKEIQDSKLNELNMENARLIEKNNKLDKDNNVLNKKLNILLNKYNEQSVSLGEMQAKVEYQNKLIEVNNNAGNMVQVDLVEMIESLEKAVNIIDANNSSSNMVQVYLVDMIEKLEAIANSYESVIKYNSSSSNMVQVDLVETVDKLDNAINMINENAKLIAGSKGNRIKQSEAKGADSNRFIQELDTEKLIEVYKENNYSIPKNVFEYYNRQYGITYNGLRNRLIKAGVWRSRN